MIQIPESIINKKTKFIVATLVNYEEMPSMRHFEEIGKDVRFTFKIIDTQETFSQVFHLDNQMRSVDWGYIKPLLRQTISKYLSNQEIDFNLMVGQVFIIGTEEVYSPKTRQTYQNITVFVPITDGLKEKLAIAS
ncbi:hypothetical protein [Enterococcus sp. BWR-S5]|uniref:hypothetical protein n=1 Tax=Enterococcus sp. BWR-S5 TaxID=2787714 RepID=UPI00192279D1|nr:hypothetical protein [Enterococcus sp. BWR-S5]MBL1224206.1 hypothetical protein [Enterococcus sp. BWR-S5]